jgi:hypothetical protein
LEAVIVSRRARLVEAGWETVGLGLLYVVFVLLGLWWDWVGVGAALGVLGGAVGLTFLWRYAVSEVPAPVVAGSAWVGTARRRGSRVAWLYELSRIDAATACDGEGEPIPGSTALILQTAEDSQGLRVDLALLQANSALWDLVHHGITSSVTAGAHLTPAAQTALRQR